MRRSAWLLIALAACSSGGPGQVFSIEVKADGSGPLLITAIGGTLQLKATPRDANSQFVSNVPLTWGTSNPLVATVDGQGLVTGAGNGTADITVSSGPAGGRVTVTVAQAASSAAVSPPSASVERGATTHFTLSALDSRGHAITGPVEWSSDDEGVATVDADGTATGVATGTANLHAKVGGKTGTALLTVAVPAAASVAVSSTETSALTSVGDTRQLTASAADARDAAIPEASFTWTSSDETVATVSVSGLVTAKKNGSTTVTATSGTAHGSITVAVAQAVHSVSVAPSSQSIAPDALFTFTAQALDARAHVVAGAAAPAWTVDDTGVATIDVSTGQAHANANAVALSSTQVNAAVGAVAGHATLTVDPAMAPVVSIDLPQPGGSLASIGATVQLTATAKNNANNAVPGVVFDWHSDDVNVVTVSATGLVTAAGNGTTRVHASGGGKSASVSLTVEQVVTQVVLATPEFTTFTSIDDTLQLSAEAEDADGHVVTAAPIVWSSGDSLTISVSNTGLATAKANGGPVTITATSGTFHDEVALTVTQAVFAVNVSPSSDSILPGTHVDFSAAGVDAHGHLVADAPGASWETDNEHVTIDSHGHAAVDAADTFLNDVTVVTITATIAGVSGSASLTVDKNLTPVDHVVVTGGGVTLASIGATVQLSAQAQDASNNPLARSISWSILDGSSDVVTVNSTGLVTAVNNGQKTIVASAGGVMGTATVTVEQVVASVAVSKVIANAPATLTSLGDTLALHAQALDANGHPLPPGPVFTWRSDSAHATVDVDGLVTAASDGTANIFAAANGTIESAAFLVTIAQAVDHITVSGTPTTLHSIGETVQLAAAAFDARDNAMSATFTWSPTTGAAAITDQAGLVTAQSNGSVNIQASSGGKTGTLQVTVSQAIVSVAVSGASTLASIEETAQLSATALDANAHAVPGVTFTWRCDATDKVTVGATGVITAVANGSANVFARDNGTLIESAAHLVTVAQVVDAVAITGGNILNSIGQTSPLLATAIDANSHGVAGITFVWSIQDGSTSVITIDAGTGVVTAVSNGQKTVQATGGGKTGTIVVQVQQAAATVTASGSPTTLTSLGETTTLSASANDANGHPISGATFTWRSDNTAHATVGSGTGVVTAVADGTAGIIATANGVDSNTVTVTVAQAVASVTVSPKTASIAQFFTPGTRQFTLTAKDARGNSMAGAQATATWTSSNTNTATITSPGGLATAVNFSAIPVTITGSFGGFSDTASLTVTEY